MGRRVFRLVEYIIDCICSIIYGKNDTCIICGELESEEYLCPKCRNNIRIMNLKHEIEKDGIKFQCYSLGAYSFTLKKLILLLKYDKEFLAARLIAKYLSEFIKDNIIDKIDMITFIPSSRESLKKRGFNQCEVICKFVSNDCNVPYKSLMYKEINGRDQIGLDTIKRWQNVKDSFKMKKSVDINGKRILLIDDVITTGATAFYGAKCLKNSGALEVYILTVAKSRV